MSRRNPLVLLTPREAIGTRAQARSQRLVQPPYLADFSDYSSVEFVLAVTEILGSPTSFTMKPRFETGTLLPVDGDGFQTSAQWAEMSAESLAARVVEGIDFPDITGLGQWSRTVTNPPALLRLNLGESGANALSFVGGSTPLLRVSLVAYPKG